MNYNIIYRNNTMTKTNFIKYFIKSLKRKMWKSEINNFQ